MITRLTMTYHYIGSGHTVNQIKDLFTRIKEVNRYRLMCVAWRQQL